MLATYTANDRFDEWLGGEDAYRSQTERVAKRLVDNIANIQNDPIFLGHTTERFTRAAPRAADAIARYAPDPVKARERLNYHACMTALTVGEVLAALDGPQALLDCHDEKVRTNGCVVALEKSAEFREVFKRAGFRNICPWTSDEEAGMPQAAPSL